MADRSGMTGDGGCYDDAVSIYSIHKIIRQNYTLKAHSMYTRPTHADMWKSYEPLSHPL